MLKKKLPMRSGVGVIILNNENKVFVGKRKDNPVDKWQMPQGGVDIGEDYISAMKRELYEELLYLPASIGLFFSYTYSLEEVNITDRETTVFTCSMEKDDIDKLNLKEGRCFSFFITQELKNRIFFSLDLSVVLMHQLSNYMPNLLNRN